jgi:hypothetical protein
MYAEIPGAEADKFKMLISEGRVYVFRKFVVSISKAAYRPFPTPKYTYDEVYSLDVCRGKS